MEAGRTIWRLQSCKEEIAAAWTSVVTEELERDGQVWQVEPIGSALRLNVGSKDTGYWGLGLEARVRNFMFRAEARR